MYVGELGNEMLEQVQVVNVRSKQSSGVVYIARAGRGRLGSALGNPFVLRDESGRDEVVEQYRRWLWEQVRSGTGAAWEELVKLAQRVAAGEAVRLGCWCAPRRCHGDVVRSCLEWMIEQNTHLPERHSEFFSRVDS
jgi:hypothetical protein